MLDREPGDFDMRGVGRQNEREIGTYVFEERREALVSSAANLRCGGLPCLVAGVGDAAGVNRLPDALESADGGNPFGSRYASGAYDPHLQPLFPLAALL